jgi:hypothetical protein
MLPQKVKNSENVAPKSQNSENVAQESQNRVCVHKCDNKISGRNNLYVFVPKRRFCVETSRPPIFFPTDDVSIFHFSAELLFFGRKLVFSIKTNFR